MPFLASQFTLDSSSSDGRCNYPMFALGGAPVPTTVVSSGVPLLIIAGEGDSPYVCTPAPGFANDPLPCVALPRTVRAEVNKSVLINGKFPVVSGDVVNSNRPLTDNFQQPRIVIGSNTN